MRCFLGWCVKSGRVDSNPLRFLPKQSEAQDRRRERRALTDEELSRLLSVAQGRGRKLWYLMALWGGLRLSELKRLAWRDVDLQRGVLVVSQGKAKRVDEVPIHPELEAELKLTSRLVADPSAPVFPTAVTNATRRRDFERAGIELVDEAGRFADLHALRSTLATKLAQSGVTPQVAQKIMRHSDYRTTVQFYTRLRLADTTSALHQLRAIDQPESGEIEGEVG